MRRTGPGGFALFRVLPLLAFAVIALLTSVGRASLYQPEDPIVIPVASDGTGRDIPFDDFEKRFTTRVLELNPVFKDSKGENKAREVVLKRIAERRRALNRSSLENAALAADLLRIGKPDDAESVLASDRRGYLPNVTLAHACAAKGEWAKAAEYLSIANEERPPTELKGWSKAQLDWELKLDRGPLTRLFEARALEARTKIVPENEDLDAIFPVKFVNEAGKYEPGKFTGQLPPDAIAVVQQILLWSPIDTRLYWLLGELYAAQGKFADAKKIMDQCVSEARQYGNRKILMDHRTAVRAVADAEARRNPDMDVTVMPPGVEPAADDAKPQPDKSVPFDLGAVWVYFGIVAVVVVLAVVRALTRPKGRRGFRR